MNVLMALAWPSHVHHRQAVSWFVEVRDDGWSTCPTTESGFVRVSSNQRALPDARHPVEACALLSRLRDSGRHHFWVDDTSLAEDVLGLFGRVVSHRQVTDAHLLALAVRQEGLLATFDRGIAGLAGEHAPRIEQIGDDHRPAHPRHGG